MLWKPNVCKLSYLMWVLSHLCSLATRHAGSSMMGSHEKLCKRELCWAKLTKIHLALSPWGTKMLCLGEHHDLRCIRDWCLYTGGHAWEACRSLCSTGETGRGMVRAIQEVSLQPAGLGFVAGPYSSKQNWVTPGKVSTVMETAQPDQEMCLQLCR